MKYKVAYHLLGKIRWKTFDSLSEAQRFTSKRTKWTKIIPIKKKGG